MFCVSPQPRFHGLKSLVRYVAPSEATITASSIFFNGCFLRTKELRDTYFGLSSSPIASDFESQAAGDNVFVLLYQAQGFTPVTVLCPLSLCALICVRSCSSSLRDCRFALDVFSYPSRVTGDKIPCFIRWCPDVGVIYSSPIVVICRGIEFDMYFVRF